MEPVVVALTAVAVLLVLGGLAFAARVLLLGRRRGAFDCSWRSLGQAEERWALGVARVTHDAVEWWRVASLSPRPRSRWRRGALHVEARHDVDPRRAPGLLAGSLVVRCSEQRPDRREQGPGEFELAMSPDAYTGLASWLEAAPPRGADGRGVT